MASSAVVMARLRATDSENCTPSATQVAMTFLEPNAESGMAGGQRQQLFVGLPGPGSGVGGKGLFEIDYLVPVGAEFDFGSAEGLLRGQCGIELHRGPAGISKFVKRISSDVSTLRHDQRWMSG